jgi:hypothetical protein
MRPTQDDLAAAAEYIGLHLHPEELRRDYVSHLRNPRAWGDVLEWIQWVLITLQTLDEGLTRLWYEFLCAVVAAGLVERFKKPDANVERLRDELRALSAEQRVGFFRLEQKQREDLAKLKELIKEGPGRGELSNPEIVMEKARLSLQVHERALLQLQDSDPQVIAGAMDALRQLEARGAKTLVDDVNAAGGLLADSSGNLPKTRWWLPDAP